MASLRSKFAAEYTEGLSAFTLVELMISIAMVVLLLIGVNQVFKYTTQAVSVGQTMSAAVRDSRAAQTALNQDFANAAGANDGPFFIIHSAQVYAFRNRADLAADNDQDASTIDINGNGIEGESTVPGEIIPPTTYNYRNHRVDTLSFFSRGTFPAQTGSTQFVYSTASTEARIWYGMLSLPDGRYLNPNDGTYPGSGNPPYWSPGLAVGTSKVTATGSTAANNPNNFFATDWVLGRVATLLMPSPPASVNAYYYYSSSYPLWSTSVATTPATLAPLSDTAVASADGNSWYAPWSRLDVASTSISSFYNQLSAYLNPTTGNATTNLTHGGWANQFFVGNFGAAVDAADNPYGQLFQCNPFVTTFSTNSTSSNITPPAKMARTSPFFLKGCTQFTVEFAGDFVQQEDNPEALGNVGNPDYPYKYGQVKDIVTTSNGKADGLDYELVYDPTTLKYTKRIRWYGLPRNTQGAPYSVNGTSTWIPGNSGSSYNSSTKMMAQGSITDSNYSPTANYLADVVPLRDVIASSLTATTDLNNALAAAVANGPAPQWIERILPGDTSGNGLADYTNVSIKGISDYLVAWGPDSDAAGIPRPKLIRITMTLDDPASPNKDGQTYQYVFALP